MTASASLRPSREADSEAGAYVHATAVAIGEAGILIRGASGAGKSRLALELIAEARLGGLFASLVGDDRVAVGTRGGRLIARPHPAIAGQIESRGEGILHLGCEAAVVIRVVVDIGAELPLAATRLPETDASKTCICDVAVPRLRLAGPGFPQASVVFAYLLRMRNG